jgi:hypothetical protein
MTITGCTSNKANNMNNQKSFSQLSKAERMYQKYHGKIKVGLMPKTGTFSTIMDEMLQEWNPKGERIEALERILGKPQFVEGDTVIYSIHNDMYGSAWQFTIKRGKIVKWRKVPVI